MTEAPLVFELPLPSNTANKKYGHPMARHRGRKAYWDGLDTRVTIKQLPRPPRRPFDQARAAIEIRTFRAMDRDNANARLKDPIDWLRTRGYIRDDREPGFTYTLELRTAPLHDVGLTIVLTALADPA